MALRSAAVLLAIGLVLVAAACEPDAPARSRDAGRARAPARGKQALPVEPPRGLPSGPAQPVTFESRDGVTLAGTLRRARDRGASAVVLVHQVGSTRAEWAPLVDRLVRAPGLTVLAFDVRGHGESTHAGRRTLAYSSFRRSEWAKIAADVAEAVAFLRTSSDPALRPRRVCIVGSSIGSSAAIVAAAADPRIDCVVAISPGRAYHGIDALTPASRLGTRPILAVASRDELHCAESAAQIAGVAPRGEEAIYEGSRHGVTLVEDAPEALDRIERFLRHVLAP